MNPSARKLIILKDHALVPLQNKDVFAKIDLDNVELIGAWNWYLQEKKYRQKKNCGKSVCRGEGINGKTLNCSMARTINKTPDHLLVKFLNGNPLDSHSSFNVFMSLISKQR